MHNPLLILYSEGHSHSLINPNSSFIVEKVSKHSLQTSLPFKIEQYLQLSIEHLVQNKGFASEIKYPSLHVLHSFFLPISVLQEEHFSFIPISHFSSIQLLFKSRYPS